MRYFEILTEAMKPKLVVAYKLDGKVTVGDVGQTHIDMGRLLPYLYPGKDVSRAEVWFVNHKGQFLNRRQAWVYATENDLVGDHAKSKMNYSNPDRPQELDTDDLLKKAKYLSDESAEIDEASRYATPTPDHIAAIGKTPIGKYLYHGTPLDCVANILKTNILYTGVEHRGEGDRVALTRSYAVAEDFAGYSSGGGDWGYKAILVLDWVKLAQDYEIHPYRDTYYDGAERNDEQEEAVYGNIRPLSKYLVSVNIDPTELKNAMNDPDWIAMCLKEKSFFKGKRGLFNMMRKLIDLPILNKTK